MVTFSQFNNYIFSALRLPCICTTFSCFKQ